jgi:type IV secretion system protein VirB5
LTLAGLSLLLATSEAHAQFAVFDAASVARLVAQAQTLAQQLEVARAQLAQVQAQYTAMTGNRGMQNLLNGTVRNYLPTQSTQLNSVLQGNPAGFSALSADVQATMQANAVLSPQQLAALPPAERAQIASSRQSVALLQGVADQALSNASARFASLQQLINAMPAAADQKGILELQARINAEQAMLQNEQTKLQVLYETAVAQQWAARQREREQVVAGHGNFATRFEPSPR